MAVDPIHALMTLKEFKQVRGIEDDKHNFLIEFLIDAVSLYFEKECGGRIFIEATYGTMFLDGTGNRILEIPHYPITSIATVEEDEIELTEGNDEDYVIYGDEGQGYIERMGNWSKGNKNIELTDLKAGYLLASVPKDLKLAAMILMEKEFQKMINKAGAEESRSFPDMSLTWNFDQDQFVKKTIKKYRRMGL